MKFYIENVIIWMKNGNIRNLQFKKNKVNIITGGSNSGKSAILSIIDYCFMADKPKIPQDDLFNNNVDWYGIRFYINDRHYTIGRIGLKNKLKQSNEFYFSGSGNIPEKPISNMNQSDIKKVLNVEFSIDDNVIIPYGGDYSTAGNKVSLRYFLLFNSQDENTIINSDVFFDKQTDPRYQEALHRIFDLSLCITTIQESLIEEEINTLQKSVRKLERKESILIKENLLFEKELNSLILKAKEYDLIDSENFDINKNIEKLKFIVSNNTSTDNILVSSKLDKLKIQRSALRRELKNMLNYKNDFNLHKSLVKNTYDSLLPVKYIEENFSELIKTPELNEFINQIKYELLDISDSLASKSPIIIDIKSELKDLKKKLQLIDIEISSYPEDTKTFNNDREKYIFIGELKNKLESYERKWSEEDLSKEIFEKNSTIKNLNNNLEDKTIRKDIIISMLHDFINSYLESCGDALENYQNYKAAFDYKNKLLKLRKYNTTEVISIIGSSSNYLFLHLCLFLGLHELFISQKSRYIPSFLLLDQPSRPYYDNTNEKVKDKQKITIAMQLLNDFINKMNNEYEKDFQFIVVEHIPPSIWIDNNMSNFNLVAEFVEDNKLIRKIDML